MTHEERLLREWSETVIEGVIDGLKALEPALSELMRAANRAVEDMHEEERRRLHPRLRDGLPGVHRRYRRNP